MKKNRIYILSVLVVIFLVPALLKTFFSLRYSDQILRNNMNSVMKESLNRAAQFEDISIDFCGNIVVSPFNLSVSNDFNDNLSLVKSDKMVIDLDFIDLLGGKITIRGFTVANADIRILKSYGKNYREAFDQLIDLGMRLKGLAKKNKVNVDVTLKDCTVTYDEVFKDEKITILFSDVYSSVSMAADSFEYYLKMTVPPNGKKEIGTGEIELEGEVFDSAVSGYKHEVMIDNLDLSYLSRYSPEISPYPVALKGALTADMVFSLKNDIFAGKGDIETDNLHVYSGNGSLHPIILNENLDLYVDFSSDTTHGAYVLNRLKISDEIMKFSAKGRYLDNAGAHLLEGSFESNTIDLEDLTHFFMPLENHYYSGELSFKGDIFYDIKNNDARKSVFSLDLTDFMLMDITKGAEKTLISECDMNLDLKGNSVTAKFKGKTAASDYSLTAKTSISSWNPLQSMTEASLHSKKIELSVLKRATSDLIDRVVGRAYEDALTGYEDVMFLQKPLSGYLTNNDVSLECSADLIALGQGKKASGLKDFNLSLEMKKGVVALKEFSLSGYGATYTLDLQAYFANDYPHCTMTGSARDIDLALLSRDVPGLNLTGRATFDFDYELNIYRFAHIVENSKGSARISASQGSISSGPLLNGIKGMLQSGGYKISAENEIPFTSFSLSTIQSGEMVYLQNASLSGSGMNFNLSGKYTYRGGLDLAGSGNVTVVEKRGDLEVPVSTYIPFWMQGPISAPCATVKNKTAKAYCF